MWADTVWKEHEYIDKNMRGHIDDVTAMCFCQPSTLCTGGCDGKVRLRLVWPSILQLHTILSTQRHQIKSCGPLC